MYTKFIGLTAARTAGGTAMAGRKPLSPRPPTESVRPASFSPPPQHVCRYEENYPGADIDGEELAFLRAIERFQREHRRRYPTWREVLGIAKALGYRKVARAYALDLELLYPLAESDSSPASGMSCGIVSPSGLSGERSGVPRTVPVPPAGLPTGLSSIPPTEVSRCGDSSASN